jgi:intein-encoded DNA endonuclease-like protein
MRKIIISQEQTDNIINLYKSGLSSIKISKIYDHTPQLIRYVLKKNKIVLRNSKQILSQEQTDSILTLHKLGSGTPTIHSKTGIGISIIRRVLKENGINFNYYKRYFNDENFFETIDSEDKSYWLGFLYADGCVRIRKYGCELSLGLQYRDKGHIESFKRDIKSSNLIKDSINKYTYKGDIKSAMQSRISIYSCKIVNDLIKLGCVQRKSLITKFPKDLVPMNLVRHFIRGYFDGDGSICLYNEKRFKLYICGGSKIFLEKIKDIFNENDVKFQSIIQVGKHNYRLNIHRISDMEKIFHYFYDESHIFLERKKIKFNKIRNQNENFKTI